MRKVIPFRKPNQNGGTGGLKSKSIDEIPYLEKLYFKTLTEKPLKYGLLKNEDIFLWYVLVQNIEIEEECIETHQIKSESPHYVTGTDNTLIFVAEDLVPENLYEVLAYKAYQQKHLKIGEAEKNTLEFALKRGLGQDYSQFRTYMEIILGE